VQNIATHVRVISHQTNYSVSLLTHLGATGISMLSTTNSTLGPGAQSKENERTKVATPLLLADAAESLGDHGRTPLTWLAR
jgi:hypothetical protein